LDDPHTTERKRNFWCLGKNTKQERETPKKGGETSGRKKRGRKGGKERRKYSNLKDQKKLKNAAVVSIIKPLV